MSALKILTQLILKDTIKQKNLMLEFTGQAKKGIASLENLPVLRKDAESKASKLLVDARERGIDLSKLSAEQIKKTYNFSKEVRNQKRMMKTETPKSKDEVSPFMGFKPKIVPKGLSDEVATSQINKLRENLPSMSRNELDQLVKDVINRKAYASFDDAQRKELLDAIEYQTTHKPDFASGGIARVGFSKGKLAKGFFEFVEGLFIKASNDIRQGKGKWAGLDQKQRMVQHDNLTKMVTQWQKTKQLPEGAEQYFGVDAKKVFTQMNEKKDDILKNLTHDFKGKPYKGVAQTVEGTVVDERTMLKQKYPGITDDLLDQILVDANPQRKADVMATMDQYMKLREVGKSEQEAFNILTKDLKKPTKHASGGIVGPLHLYDGGRAKFDKGGMSRRKFLQLMGGLSALPFVGKFFKAAKPISKAAAPAAEVITKGAGGIPDYAYDLINVVKAKGTKEIMEGIYKRNPPSKKYTYKGVEVVEDGMGNTSVKKEVEGFGVDEAGEGYEGISREVGFDINKGENIVKQGGKGDDAGKVIQTDDDYFEATVRPDSEGKMKDMEEFISVEDHLDLKKIADEAKDITIKKASGGLAHVLGV